MLHGLYLQIFAPSDYGFGLTISILSMFGLCFLYASFIVFPIQERQSKVTLLLLCLLCCILQAKHLQFVSGVNASSYWLATFAWDLINAFLPSIIVIILFAAFHIDGYKNENIGAVFLLIVSYGYCYNIYLNVHYFLCRCCHVGLAFLSIIRSLSFFLMLFLDSVLCLSYTSFFLWYAASVPFENVTILSIIRYFR